MLAVLSVMDLYGVIDKRVVFDGLMICFGVTIAIENENYEKDKKANN